MRKDHTQNAYAILLAASVALGPGCARIGGSSRDDRKSQKTSLVGKITVLNHSSRGGKTVVQVVQPLRQGDHHAAPSIATDRSHVCQVTRMGASWPDGSIRYLRLDVPVSLDAGLSETRELHASDQPPPAFVVHPAIPASPPGIQAGFRVGQGSVQFPDPELIEDGPVVRVYRSRVRAPNSMLWAELHTHLYSDLPHAKFLLQWGNSHPGRPELHEDPGEVSFSVTGAGAVFEHAAAKILARSEANGTTTVLLHRSGPIGDGQSQVVEGRFLYLASAEDPPRISAISKDWVSTRAYGPFGELIPEIKVDPQAFEKLVAEDERYQVDHPWAPAVHGCNPNPSNTGTQPDFGTLVMRADLLLADPSRLPTITRSVYQEACRTTHYRELDLRPVMVENHPNLLTLNGRPKNEGRYPDLLGKPNASVKQMARSPRGSMWTGHDPEHLSLNYLGAVALVVGNRWAIRECEHHVELWLSGFTVDTGTYNDSQGPARKIGRSLLAACWLYLVTGRKDLETLVRGRLLALQKYMETPRPPEIQGIRVLAPRGSAGAGYYWPPWEEGIGACGILAAQRLLGGEQALELAGDVGRIVTMHGFGKMNDTSWRIGYELPFLDASGKTYYAIDDPAFAQARAAGHGLTTWGMPAVVIAAELSPHPEVRERALAILQQRYGSVPISGLDSSLSWICVSPRVVQLAGLRGASQ